MEITTRRAEDIQYVEMKGRLDLSGAETAGKVFEQIFKENPDRSSLRLLLDFKEITYISSGGLRILVQVLKNLSASGGKMALVNMNIAVEEVFQFAGLDTVFPILATCEEGVKALKA